MEESFGHGVVGDDSYHHITQHNLKWTYCNKKVVALTRGLIIADCPACIETRQKVMKTIRKYLPKQ